MKLKEQQEFWDALLAQQLAEEEKQRVQMRVLEEEARCIEKEMQKQQAQNTVTSLIRELDNHLSVLDDHESNRLREQKYFIMCHQQLFNEEVVQSMHMRQE